MRAFAPFLASLLALGLVAPPAPAAELAEQSFGVVAGRLGGLGFSYRQFLDSGWGFGLGGIAFANQDYYSQSWKFYGNLGVQGYYTLARSTYSRLYLVGGAAAFSGFADAYAVGSGLGISVGIPHGVGFALEVPYTFASTQGLVMIPTASVLYSF